MDDSTRKALFNAIRTIKGAALTDADVARVNAVLAGPAVAVPIMPDKPGGMISARVALEIVGHEAIVPQAYKDSVGVWTWSAGITSASGHAVERYRDNPQPMRHCLEVFVWLLTERYAPDVRAAFAGRALTESQFAAALSFHYNTGAIKRASWVKSWLAGDVAAAKVQFMAWNKPAEIVKRREAERDLFFEGRWSADGKATVYDVAKPSYAPKWSSARRVDIAADVAALLEG